ncbi:molybdate ABC transporter substrate-binding protein [Desulfovibrio sp. OttesenSCG-928-A18]|nr:molybdate ABC transporter substrate-binding protein [Desulfovibrio sp. OttesenSCG-928-A18]
MRRLTLSALVLCGFLTVFHAPSGHAADITVSAAASLTNAFGEIRDAFMARHPGVTVTTNFAASNPLLRQIESGAPVDVFASADQATMDKASAGKLVDEDTRVDFALNELVLITPAEGAVALSDLRGLSGDAVKKLALGNPESVPAGRYARAALSSAGLWESLQPKLIMGESVRQTLDYVVRGEVEAGIVYMTDARQAGDKVRIAAVLTGHDPVLYPIALIRDSASPKEARAFIDFVLSDEGAAILARYGFAKPKK